MDNLAIARVLAEIGDLLEIKGENPFKIRAYRNAAERSRTAAEPRGRADAGRRLRSCRASARISRRRSRELAETGDDRLSTRSSLAEFPPTILDLLHLQGVGPKTVARLYADLGIATLDDLEQAARDGPHPRDERHGREEGSADPEGARGTSGGSPAAA